MGMKEKSGNVPTKRKTGICDFCEKEVPWRELRNVDMGRFMAGFMGCRKCRAEMKEREK